MLNENRFIYQSLKSIAQRKGYSFETYSFGWIIEIRDSERVFRLTGYTFDVNSPSSILMARDKWATDALLQWVLPDELRIDSAFIPCSWKETFIGTTKESIIQSFLEKHSFPLVIKDMKGAQGRNVYLVHDTATLMDRVAFFESIECDSILSAYFESEKEVRIILLDDTVHLIYEKFAGESWKFNLSEGAHSKEIPQSKWSTYHHLIEWAKIVMNRLGLRFASCDFLVSKDGQAKFLEANGGVCVDRFIKQHPEYRESLENMYEEALEKSFISFLS